MQLGWQMGGRGGKRLTCGSAWRTFGSPGWERGAWNWELVFEGSDSHVGLRPPQYDGGGGARCRGLKSAARTAAGVLVLEELENKTINATDERLCSVFAHDPDVLSYMYPACRVVVTKDPLDRLEVVEVQR